MRHDARGIESLPVVLLLSAVLGASTLGIGLACLDQARRLSERQQAIDAFNTFTERVRMLSASGVGSAQLVEVNTGEGVIVLDENLARLVVGDEIVRSDFLPLPVLASASQLDSGSYLIELKRGADGGCFLELRWFE
ncbi:MAG TPA: hypothetical protein EYP46_02865 [Hadesarchaea archaeon]|nr:hypothetical protein [Hadesarchaea archaeon]